MLKIRAITENSINGYKSCIRIRERVASLVSIG